MFRDDPDSDHVRAVLLLAGAGVEPPAEWVELRQRLDDYSAIGTPCRDRLVSALIDPQPGDDIPALRAAAFAEQISPTAAAAVTNVVRSRIFDRMRAVHSETALESYRAIAALFDKQAALFASAATIADPEADAASMIERPDRERQAWLACESHANALTKLVPVLAAAATLCGVKDGDTSHVLLLPLCVDPGDAHRRAAWTAWMRQGGRCGRWSALAALGVTIRAHPDPATLAPYREPKPLEPRTESTGVKGQYRNYIHDPEDHPARLPAIDPYKTGRMTAV